MSNVATTQTTNEDVKKDVNETPEVETKKVIKGIEIAHTLPFDSGIKTCFINTIEIASIIDSLFCPAMRDYIGCKVSINDGSVPPYFMPDIFRTDIPYGKLYVTLFFKDRSNSGDKCPIENVKIRANSGKSKFDSLLIMSDRNRRTYDITPETYEAIDDLRFFNNRKTNWNNLTSEISSNYGYIGTYNQEVVACITGLDLEKIINKIYGSRTDDGIFQYRVVPVQLVANTTGEYLVQITQLDVTKLNDLRRSLGGPIDRTEFHACR